MIPSETSTHGVRVRATPAYESEHSRPDDSQFIFSYHIQIANESRKPVQLLSRHWIIIDADGHREDVRGPGVVGLTPRIGPGESFEYDSFCPLRTPWGTMEGSYRLALEGGAAFEARIARFVLAAPTQAVK